MSDHFKDEGERVVFYGDSLAEDVIYDFLEYSDTDAGAVAAFKEAFDVVKPKKYFMADPKEDFYQGISVMVVISRKVDGKLFGFKYWTPVSKHGEAYVEPNGDEHGLDYGDYVFLPVEPFTITGYKIKESK